MTQPLYESPRETFQRMREERRGEIEREEEREERLAAKAAAIQQLFRTENGKLFIEEWKEERRQLVNDLIRNDPRNVARAVGIQERIQQLDNWLKRATGKTQGDDKDA